MKKNPNIELLRWLSVLAVIVQHVNFDRRYSISTNEGILVLKEVMGWCVFSFFSISGYLSRFEIEFFAFVQSRAKRLLIPYVCASFVAFSVIFIINRIGFYSTVDDLSVRGFLVRLLTLDGYGPQYYFLPYLFFISVGWRWLHDLWGGGYVMLVVVVALAVQCIFYMPTASTGASWDRFLPYCFAYGLGVMFSGEGKSDIKLRYIIVAGFSVGLVIFYVWHIGFLAHLFAPFGVYRLLLVMPWAEYMGNLAGRFSAGAVYLWHCPIVLPMMSVLLLRIGIREWSNVLGACILAVLLSLVIHRVLCILKIERYCSL